MKTGLIILLILDVIKYSITELRFRQDRTSKDNITAHIWSLPTERAKVRHQWGVTLPNQNEKFKDSSKVAPQDGFNKGIYPTETYHHSSDSSRRVYQSSAAQENEDEMYSLKIKNEEKAKNQLTNSSEVKNNSNEGIGIENLKFRTKKKRNYEGGKGGEGEGEGGEGEGGEGEGGEGRLSLNTTKGIHLKEDGGNSTKTKVTDVKMYSPHKDFSSNSIFLRKENNEKLKILNFLREIPSLGLPVAEPLAAIPESDERNECVEKVVENFVVTDDIVASDILSDRNEAERLTTALRENQDDLDEMTEAMESSMKKHPKITSISVTVMNISKKLKKSLTVYKKNEEIFIDKQSRSYPEYRKNEKTSWTALFLNCLMKTYIFGYSFAIEKGQERLETTVYFGADNINTTVDQCKSSFRQVLNGGPKCDETTTKCAFMHHTGFKIGGYKCVCREGFYFPDNYSANNQYFEGFDIEKAFAKGNSSHYKCIPCPESCTGSCDSSGVCIFQRNNVLKNFILSIQIFCILMTFLLIVLIFKHRKCKTIAIGMWTILEMILLGSIILYSTVIIRAFNATTILCLIEPWFREIGFVLCYGAIMLKLYRILIEFRTRKAHRWVIRDKDLLKYLLGMVIVVLGYMSAWTASNLNLIQKENYSMLLTGITSDGGYFESCKPVWWDYVTEMGEILILIFGIHLSYASRNATTQFRERCFLCISISVEAFFSFVFYVLRYFSPEISVHPDYSFVANFIRSQLTTTVVLVLLFAPKWWYQRILNNKSKVSRNYLSQESSRGPLEAFKPQDGINAANNDMEAEISLADMNPEDIRAELKRLYTQLEVLKNKTIRMDNPHISKRRGGRKIAHRRFSLQALRQQPQRLSSKHTDAEMTEADGSRTPEDSICSNEGPSIIINDGPSDIVQMTPKKGQK